MKINTLKTTLGYLRSLSEKYSGISFKRKSLNSIYNYHRILGDDWALHTSGQPTESQFEVIKSLGIKTVINLAPASAENALSDEQRTVTQLGLKYVHLPVDFKRPTDDDFRSFVELMRSNDVGKLWVHCAANMRVSAFVYRYRCVELGHNSELAKKDLDAIWEPFGVWRKFVAKTRPNH